MIIDTVFCDYGGVVADHYSEPFQGRLAGALGVTRHEVRSLLSEHSEHGRLYRLNAISRATFWNVVRTASSRRDFSDELVQRLWAQTYIPNDAVLTTLSYLRYELGVMTGIVMNEDYGRLAYIEATYHMSTVVDHVVASCEIGAVKPEREVYVEILRRADRLTAPGHVLYVDDRESHVAAARAIGVEGYLFQNAGDFSMFIGDLVESGSFRRRASL